MYGDFSNMIIFETGTCCILIQLDWNSINQNKTIVGIRMLYPNKKQKDNPFACIQHDFLPLLPLLFSPNMQMSCKFQFYSKIF